MMVGAVRCGAARLGAVRRGAARRREYLNHKGRAVVVQNRAGRVSEREEVRNVARAELSGVRGVHDRLNAARAAGHLLVAARIDTRTRAASSIAASRRAHQRDRGRAGGACSRVRGHESD